MIQLLNCEEKDIQIYSAKALGKMCSEKAVEDLLKVIDDPGDRGFKIILEALGRIGGGRAYRGIIDYSVNRHIDVSLLFEIAEILKENEADKSAKYLFQIANDTSLDVLIQRRATELLGCLQFDGAVDFLMHLSNSRDREKSSAAIMGLGWLDSTESIDALLDLSRHECWDVRSNAIKSFGSVYQRTRIKVKKVEKALLNLLREEKNPGVRRAIAEALGYIDSEEALKVLIEILENKKEKSYVRYTAVSALHYIGYEKAEEALSNALTCEKEEYMLGVLIDTVKSEKAIKALEALSSHNNTDVRWLLMRPLEKIVNNKSLDILIKILKNDKSPKVRCRAAWALSCFGRYEKAIDALIEGLKDKDDSVKHDIACVLGKMGDRKAGDALLELFSYKNNSVRIKAIEAIGLIRFDKAIQMLIKIVEDKNDPACSIAIYALAQMDSGKIVEPLVVALKNVGYSESLVYFSLRNMLGGLRSDKIVNQLIEMLKDGRSKQKKAAIDTLGYIGGFGDLDLNGTIMQLSGMLGEEKTITHLTKKALKNIATDKSITVLINFLKEKRDELVFELSDFIHGPYNDSRISELKRKEIVGILAKASHDTNIQDIKVHAFSAIELVKEEREKRYLDVLMPFLPPLY